MITEVCTHQMVLQRTSKSFSKDSNLLFHIKTYKCSICNQLAIVDTRFAKGCP